MWRMRPAISMAWVASKIGSAYQKLEPELTQPAAVSENGSDESAQTPMNNARSNQRVWAEVRNNAPPTRIKAVLQAAAPTGLARNAVAKASDPMPSIQ